MIEVYNHAVHVTSILFHDYLCIYLQVQRIGISNAPLEVLHTFLFFNDGRHTHQVKTFLRFFL